MSEASRRILIIVCGIKTRVSIYSSVKPTVYSVSNLSPTQLFVPRIPQMAAGVRHMHKLGLIHRDIKAENFVFAESPAVSKANNRPLVVTIIDLGMAMQYDRMNEVRGAARA